MNYEDLTVLAMTETLLIWDRIVNTPESFMKNKTITQIKARVIADLHGEGMLFRESYFKGCPLCHHFSICLRCPLEHNGKGCGDPESLYRRVMSSRNKGRKAVAFFNMLQAIALEPTGKVWEKRCI
jgi:hypothetical protein